MDFKTLFFSKFWNESFYTIFFRDTLAYCISSHSDIINNYVTKRHFLLFLFLFFCSFLFFFVIFLVAMQILMAFFKFFFFFNLKHSRIYMKLESKRDPLKRNNNNNKIDIHRYLYFSTYLRVINKQKSFCPLSTMTFLPIVSLHIWFETLTLDGS